MRKTTLADWEKKYITGQVTPFDQKYTLFKRLAWDKDLRSQLPDWSFFSEAKDKPGHTLQDRALSTASRRLTQLQLFNTSKPNPGRLALALATAMGRTSRSETSRLSQLSSRPRVAVSDAAKLTRDIKKVARFFGADLVGICSLDRRWVYSHTYEGGDSEFPGGLIADSDESKPQEIPPEFQYAVVLAFAEDYELMTRFPTFLSEAATAMGYSRMAVTSAHLTAYIHALGSGAINCSINDVALSVPMAMQAGLGELGRHGLLITPRFGPRVRLEKVLTDLPLVPDTPIDFGVTEFCTVCWKCAEMCPTKSISFDERNNKPINISNASNELKWYVNGESCRLFWSKSGKSCTICRAVCPYNKVDSFPHRTVRWFTDHCRWADMFYVQMDDFFGYGKPKKADSFWEEWYSR